MRSSDGTKNVLSVTPYNLRYLHEISTMHTKQRVIWDFPEDIVLTLY